VSAAAGLRLCEVASSRDSGAYRVVSLVDREGPDPAAGQFYGLAPGGADGRAGPPRPTWVAETARAGRGGVRLDFLLGPGDPDARRLGALGEGEEAWIAGPFGEPFAAPAKVRRGAAGAVLVGGGAEVAPLALLRRRFAERAVPHRVLLGFRDRAHTGGLDLFCGSSGVLCPEVRLATEDGHAGHRGPVTDLLRSILAGDDAGSGVVYAAGPPAMIEAARRLCEERGVAFETRTLGDPASASDTATKTES
jgi:NAD(P)H-flavin reductase